MASSDFAPRGWRAALAAEQHSLPGLRQQGTGRITPRQTPQQPARTQPPLAERSVEWMHPGAAAAECAVNGSLHSSGTVAVTPTPAWAVFTQGWLLAAMLAACLAAFLAGWALGRWQSCRSPRSKEAAVRSSCDRAVVRAKSIDTATAAIATAAVQAAAMDRSHGSTEAAGDSGDSLPTAAQLLEAAPPVAAFDAQVAATGSAAVAAEPEQGQDGILTAAVAAAGGALAGLPLEAAERKMADPSQADMTTANVQLPTAVGQHDESADETTPPSQDQQSQSTQQQQQQQRHSTSFQGVQLPAHSASAPNLQDGDRLSERAPSGEQQQAHVKQQIADSAGNFTQQLPSSESEATTWQAIHRAEEEQTWRRAAQLVSAASSHLGIRVDDLSAGEKIQLISAAIGAWQTLQQRDHHQATAASSTQANQLRQQHNQLVKTGLLDKRSRHDAAEVAKGVAALQQLLTDCTFLGLSLMALAALYCGTRYGLLHVRLAACPSLKPGAISILRPWEALAPLQALACWLMTIGDVLFGVAILLGTAYVLLKTQLLANYHVMPLNKLLLGLGVFCGSLGYFAIGKIGGMPGVWLSMWWLWIAVQCAVVMNLKAVQRLLWSPDSHVVRDGQAAETAGDASPSASDAATTSRGMLSAGAKPAFVISMAVAFPLMMGCRPFDKSVVQELRTLLVV